MQNLRNEKWNLAYLKAWLEAFFTSGSNERLFKQLLRGGLGSLAVRISNIFLGLLLVILLARFLGPEQYGIYAHVFAIISLLIIPVQLGLPRLLIRETAKSQVDESWGLLRGLWFFSSSLVAGSSVSLILVAFIVLAYFPGTISEIKLATVYPALLLIPVLSLGALRGAALQGLRRVVWGLLPEHVIRPVILILLTIAAVSATNIVLSSSLVMYFHVVAATLAFGVGIYLLKRNSPEQIRGGVPKEYDTANWLKASIPLTMTAAFQQVNQHASIILLGFMMPVEEAGIFRVAAQGALLIVFGQRTIALFVSPFFARLYKQNDLASLEKIAKTSARISFLFALPVILLIFVVGERAIIFFLGNDYSQAYLPLMILCCGQLFNTLFGHVGIVLNMTGNERETLKGMAIASVVCVVGNYILISFYGGVGAALATSITLVVWNLLLLRSVRKKIAIQPTIF